MMGKYDGMIVPTELMSLCTLVIGLDIIIICNSMYM